MAAESASGLDGPTAASPSWPQYLPYAVALNAYGEDGGDIAACTCRGEADALTTPYVGLWPAFALINHSCAPNASSLVLGGRMVVRAACALQQGEEVCITYLGAEVWGRGGEGGRGGAREGRGRRGGGRGGEGGERAREEG